MQIVDRGHGVPVVLVPGIQGRWEYLGWTVDALAQAFRVITFPLLDERTSGRRGGRANLDDLADQVSAALDAGGIERAVVCGISFGGLVALRFAAKQPARTAALVLASTPGPDFHLSPRHVMYARAPSVFGPFFLAETPRRLSAELRVAFPRLADRARFGWRQALTLITAPLSLRAMAARALLIGAASPAEDCRRVVAPTLVVTGEPALDRVVRVESTRAYLKLIRNARAVELAGTGHVGYLTQPERFVTTIRQFLTSVGTVTHDAA
jgi:pimeloyl-ACP methyl ester carboxylesterase